jgi:hypothetical protein
MEAYQYNPNDDPTLPGAVAAKDDDGLMVDHSGGYRGWGPAGAAGVGRKPSTNASSGVPQYSDTGTLVQPGSPTAAYGVDGVGHHRNGTMDSDTMGNLGPAMGGAAAAATAGAANNGLRRGVSNASSTYSNGAHSAHSNTDYPIPYHPNSQEHYADNQYYQNSSPYDNYGAASQPIMRESPARRLTQVNEGGVQPQQGGIARNF